MTSDRPYKKKQCPFIVMKTMQEEAFGRLDLSLLSTFFYNVANYYVGDYVLLNSGEIGEIVHVNPRDIFRPLLRMDDAYIDMSVESQPSDCRAHLNFYLRGGKRATWPEVSGLQM